VNRKQSSHDSHLTANVLRFTAYDLRFTGSKMNNFKRLIFISLMVVIGVADVLVYWNQHIYNRADNIENSANKIKLLRKANQIYPYNDSVYYELGKAYFDLALAGVTEGKIDKASLQRSIWNFKQAVGLNPASAFIHFNLAQSLLFLNYLTSSSTAAPFDEYKKAAILAGHRSQIYYEVGKKFLSLWPQLSKGDKDFTLNILKKIAAEKNRERLNSLMHVWEMNVKDYKVMEAVLPEDEQIYRMYASFLGEKALSMAERHKVLAEAEFMAFKQARDDYESAQNDFLYLNVEEAVGRFRACLNRLDKIKFYQKFIDEKPIDPEEFRELRRSSYLYLAKCGLEEDKGLTEVKDLLVEYLNLEKRVAAVRELESYLRERGLIDDNLRQSVSDLDRLSLQILIYFKQNRYSDIMRLGNILRKSFVVVQESNKKDYVKILQLIGDSYLKADYIYDASEFYQKALKIEPNNMETLLRLAESYKRRREERKMAGINYRVRKLLSARNINIGSSGAEIDRGQKFSRELTFDGSRINLDLYFKAGSRGGAGIRGAGGTTAAALEGVRPLVAVFFNGQVVWEGYLKAGVVRVPLETRVGKNELVIVPVNLPVRVLRIRWGKS